MTEGIGVVKSKFAIKNGYLFYGSHLCVLCGYFWEYIILELHRGGLAGHFDYDRTFVIISDRFFWPQICCNVHKVVACCWVC